MTRITLDQANRCIASAFDKAREMGLKPLTVAVLDAGGHLIALQRQDGSPTLRPQIAIGKASTALGLGGASRQAAEMAKERPGFVAALGQIAPHGVLPAAGGVLVVDEEGLAIGAVGATGDLSDHDEACVLAGCAAVGLRTKA